MPIELGQAVLKQAEKSLEDLHTRLHEFLNSLNEKAPNKKQAITNYLTALEDAYKFVGVGSQEIRNLYADRNILSDGKTGDYCKRKLADLRYILEKKYKISPADSDSIPSISQSLRDAYSSGDLKKDLDFILRQADIIIDKINSTHLKDGDYVKKLKSLLSKVQIYIDEDPVSVVHVGESMLIAIIKTLCAITGFPNVVDEVVKIFEAIKGRFFKVKLETKEVIRKSMEKHHDIYVKGFDAIDVAGMKDNSLESYYDTCKHILAQRASLTTEGNYSQLPQLPPPDTPTS